MPAEEAKLSELYDISVKTLIARLHATRASCCNLKLECIARVKENLSRKTITVYPAYLIERNRTKNQSNSFELNRSIEFD